MEAPPLKRKSLFCKSASQPFRPTSDVNTGLESPLDTSKDLIESQFEEGNVEQQEQQFLTACQEIIERVESERMLSVSDADEEHTFSRDSLLSQVSRAKPVLVPPA